MDKQDGWSATRGTLEVKSCESKLSRVINEYLFTKIKELYIFSILLITSSLIVARSLQDSGKQVYFLKMSIA